MLKHHSPNLNGKRDRSTTTNHSFLKTTSYQFSLITPTSSSITHHSLHPIIHSHHSNRFQSNIKKTLDQYHQSDQEQEQEDPIEIEERQPKRRKTVTGTILDSALELALFTSAIGYAAFQLWKGNQINPSTSQSRLPLTSILPNSTPPPPPLPYSSSIQTLQIPNTPSRRPKSISNRSSNHHSRSNKSRSNSTTPIKSIETLTQSFHQQLNLNQEEEEKEKEKEKEEKEEEEEEEKEKEEEKEEEEEEEKEKEEDLMGDFNPSINHYITPPTPLIEEEEEEEEEDLMGDFNPSINHYIAPPTPLIEEEPIESEFNQEDDLQISEFKNKIQSLIKSGHAALISKPPNLNDLHQSNHQPFSNQTDIQLIQFNFKKSNQILVLENALNQTLKQTRKPWWET